MRILLLVFMLEFRLRLDALRVRGAILLRPCRAHLPVDFCEAPSKAIAATRTKNIVSGSGNSSHRIRLNNRDRLRT